MELHSTILWHLKREVPLCYPSPNPNPNPNQGALPRLPNPDPNLDPNPNPIPIPIRNPDPNPSQGFLLAPQQGRVRGCELPAEAQWSTA